MDIELRPELFPTAERLVILDQFKSYKIKLEDNELHNEIIEQMYGPFSSTVEDNSPVSSPRPLVRNEDLAMASRQQAIDDLKRMIAERQARNESMGKNLVESTKTILKDKKEILQAQTELLREKENILQASSSRPIKAKYPLHNNVKEVVVPEVKAIRPEGLKAPIIVIDDSDEDMSIGSDEESNDMDTPVNDVKTDQESTLNAKNESSDELSSNTGSFHTALEEDSETECNEELPDDVKKLNEDYEIAQSHIDRLNGEKQKYEAACKEVQLKLLGIRVRLSMNKNRSELKKKSSRNEFENEPVVGDVRKFRSDDIIANQSHHASRRRLDYGHDNFNYGFSQQQQQQQQQQASFYQHLPHQQMHSFIPNTPTYMPLHNVHQPPPPPPTELPPFTPPPPPPPPPPAATAITTAATTVTHPFALHTPHVFGSQTSAAAINQYPVKSQYRHKKNKNTAYKPKNMGLQPPLNVESSIQPMEDQEKIQAVLKEMEQFISLRVFNDKSYHPIINDRPLSRPYRLITVDNYTMPMHMIVINENKDNEVWEYPTTRFVLPAGLPIKTEMDNSWFESPFFVMLRRRATSQSSNPIIQKAIQAIIESIPPHDDLSTIKIGSIFFVHLENTLEIARTFHHQHPKNEFFAALALELSFYVNGNNAEFIHDYKECTSKVPLSLDVEWQRIRGEVTLSCQLPLILKLLHNISLKRTFFDSKESARVSSMTVEVLIRLIRLNGLDQVLRLMAHNEIEINTEEVEIFDLDDAPGLYLQEQDKHCIWMIILYYYVNKSIPDYVCGAWMNSLVKDGKPLDTIPIFMIDWSTSKLIENPLDKTTLFGATNILLSMLRHFGNKACYDGRRKHLLVGVWRTLSNFLSNIPSYKSPGTLLLMRKAQTIIKQIPEISEIITALEIKIGTPGADIIKRIYGSKLNMSTSNLFSFSYNIARTYYEKYPFSKQNLLVVSNLLLYPLLEERTQATQMGILQSLISCAPKDISEKEGILMIDSIKQLYVDALGLDFSSSNMHSPFNDKSVELRKIAFVWINLLLLTGISKFLHPETSVIRDNLNSTIKMVFEKAMTEISSDDGRMTLFKYAQYIK